MSIINTIILSQIELKIILEFTPAGISVLKGDELVGCASKPCPGVMVAQACGGAPVGDPSIRPMDATANRKAATTAARQV
jgi:hypothetical protein